MPRSISLVRWCGLAAMLGGVLWVIGTLIHASKPRGCIAEECALRPMRESGVLDGTLMLLSLLLFAAGAVGLVILARHLERFGKLGNAGVVIGALGAALLVISGLIQALFFGGDFPLMPYFVIPGVLALILGFVLLGIAILAAGVLPKWAALLLIVGALAMLGFNEQTALALMAIPLGVAWAAVGYVLWSGVGVQTGQPAARVR
jgi:drug/metabolite transporter (DMT)-like permease